MTEDVIKTIEQILKHGNVAEVKKVYGKVEVIEIERTLKYKTPMQQGNG